MRRILGSAVTIMVVIFMYYTHYERLYFFLSNYGSYIYVLYIL